MSREGIIARHASIIRNQVVALALTAFLALGGMGLANISQNHNIESATAQSAQIDERNDFYREIAGLQGGDSLAASDKLGVALHNQFEGVDTQAEFDQVVSEFSASSRDYPGITEDLGFNPFDSGGRSCDECGSLNSTMVNRLDTIILEGNVDDLIVSVPEVDTTKTLTPLGMSVFVELLLIWQIGGGLGLAYGLARHGDPKMTWAKDGSDGQLMKVSFVLAPLPFAAFHLLYNRPKLVQRKRHDAEIIDNMGLGDSLILVENRLNELLALPPDVQSDPEIQSKIRRYTTLRDRILVKPKNLSAEDRKRALKGITAGDDNLLQEIEDTINAHELAVEEIGGL